VQYYSGKNHKDRSLEYQGHQKLRTSVKDKTGRDLSSLHLDKIDKGSVASPISYDSDQLDPEYEAVNYYQMRDTKGCSTFKRHPYA
jgi:hypothetical protein